jgi:uncharacterized protein
MLPPISDRIATELSVRPAQISAAISLLDGGATVPFVARYRKEATEGLDDTHLRHLEERLSYMRELEERRASILSTIEDQGKLSPALRASIDEAQTKQRLEDLYLPYKVKRRTKVEIAREAGLEALADTLLNDPSLDPATVAASYVREPFTTGQGENLGVTDAKGALDGARLILMERFSEDAELLGRLREYQAQNALLTSAVVEGKEASGEKFRDYFDYAEALSKVPPHRALALFRGRREDVLRISLKLPEEIENPQWRSEYGPCERTIAAQFALSNENRPGDTWTGEVVRMTWRAKLAYSIETTLLNELRERAEEEAIRVFGRNLEDLLLAAPAGARNTMGLDPGIRTGVKVAVIDANGKLIDTCTIYPFPPKKDVAGSLAKLTQLAKQHGVELVAIGNGTASRETDSLIAQLMGASPELHLRRVVVSEAGASVYSASEFAAREFPDLDVSLRGAVSIARRLQDPLAELVKIDPKSIGVGQYQHDVSQVRLAKTLDAIVEDCVNRVGVDVNTASAALLSRIAGLSTGLADNVVALRDAQGSFRNRKDLLKVPRLGPKAYEQAAGFLRISGGENPLDASAVHPEAYGVVTRILTDLGKPLTAILGQPDVVKAVTPQRYTDDTFGLPTVRDILSELEKPGRDPRPEFKTAAFKADVTELKDLEPDMRLEGVVTNVTNFGAFVDVGVHQDGLVHISMLADHFVKDPHDVVSAGDIVAVTVLEIDVARKRIALSMCGKPATPSEDTGQRTDHTTARPHKRPNAKRRDSRTSPGSQQTPQGSMAQALTQALKGKT